jgi:hypothetical protein
MEEAAHTAPIILIAHRMSDTVFVDWVGEAENPDGKSPGSYQAGRMQRR